MKNIIFVVLILLSISLWRNFDEIVQKYKNTDVEITVTRERVSKISPEEEVNIKNIKKEQEILEQKKQE